MANIVAEFPIGLASLQREAALAAPRRLPVDQWHPSRSAVIDIRIVRNGNWLHEGTPMRRVELVRLFAGLLRKDAEGFHLVTPAEKFLIQVEDAPFVAVLLDVTAPGQTQTLAFTTNVGDEMVAGPGNALRLADGAVPYVHVRGDLEARVSRAVFYELADLAVPGAGEYAGFLGVWSAGVFFPLGRAA